MRKFLRKLEWLIDIYFVWILYNPRKYDRYNEYLEKKWGKNGKYRE